MKRAALFAWALALAVSLVGCDQLFGGGGQSSSLPSIPTGLQAVAGNTQVTLTWTSVSGAASYNVYYSTSSNSGTSGTQKNGVTSGVSVTGLSNNTIYYFVVTAVNSSGESAPSSEVSATPKPAPAIPSGVLVVGGDNSVTVSWTPMSATSFNVYYATSSAGANISSTNKITGISGYTVTLTASGGTIASSAGIVNPGSATLTNGTIYYFVVTAANSSLESAVSSVAITAPYLPVSGSGKFAYVANYQGHTVSAYTINPYTGQLAAVGGSPFALESLAYPQSITVDPAGQFAFVADYNKNKISAFTVNSTSGALTEVSGSPFATGTVQATDPVSIVVDSSGKFVYAADQNSSKVSAFVIDTTTTLGALSAISGSPFPLSYGAACVASSGKFVIVGGGSGICVYIRDPSTGVLSGLTGIAAPVVTTSSISSVAATPAGTYLLATLSSAMVGADPNNKIVVYSIDSSTGALAEVGSPYATGEDPRSIAVDPTGQFVYVANLYSQNISAYSMNGSGALTEITGSPFQVDNGPSSVCVDPSGKFVYATRFNADKVAAFAINASTGSLSEVSGSPYATGAKPQSIIISK